ncbi:hypothetical protein AGDE_16554 [Angomonas deanei]|uniref:Uncharacterized protein n=1 Tax=Angomonas deanei TaxID=59799 RepID=A0A7G2CNP5_9TRYP|nr:hypothetical protein AGDE_16554 [Angomonas deanei]CAD2220163.1 hypothetical protein, conserved [Angomonas deanei]|eukprot:EPY16897.1 hypothetical protein AGDE_16554 [Angomonas deanei]
MLSLLTKANKKNNANAAELVEGKVIPFLKLVLKNNNHQNENWNLFHPNFVEVIQKNKSGYQKNLNIAAHQRKKLLFFCEDNRLYDSILHLFELLFFQTNFQYNNAHISYNFNNLLNEEKLFFFSAAAKSGKWEMLYNYLLLFTFRVSPGNFTLYEPLLGFYVESYLTALTSLQRSQSGGRGWRLTSDKNIFLSMIPWREAELFVKKMNLLPQNKNINNHNHNNAVQLLSKSTMQSLQSLTAMGIEEENNHSNHNNNILGYLPHHSAAEIKVYF